MPSKSASKIYNIGEYFAPAAMLRAIKDLDQEGVTSETVLRVASARVVYANCALLQHDFPQLQDQVLELEFPRLKPLKGKAKQLAICQKIEEWMLRNTAFVSQSQAKQSVVNTPIALGEERVKAYRPPGYGRALVFSIEDNNQGLLLGGNRDTPAFENRLIDVKGIGVGPNVIPVNGSHSNGVYQLGYAFVELVVQELLQRIFKHSKTHFQTLPSYGIIDLGFDEINDFGVHYPAGLLVRRAHQRPRDSGGLYPYGSAGQQVQLEIEQLLRKYGITSANSITTLRILKEDGQLQIHYGDQHVDFFNQEQKAEIERVCHYQYGMGALVFEGINIQQTRAISLEPSQATLLDFQTYTVKEKFDHPLLSLVSDKLLRWGGTIWPDYDEFVCPDPGLKIPYHLVNAPGNIWGYNMGEGSKKINSLCFGLAADFRANQISREMLLETLQLYLDALTAHWSD